jgi:hypothetical protein
MVIANNESDPNSDNSDPGNSDGDSILDSKNKEPATCLSITRPHCSSDLDANTALATTRNDSDLFDPFAALSAAENECEIGVGQHSQLSAQFASHSQSNEAIGEAEFVGQWLHRGLRRHWTSFCSQKRCQNRANVLQ